MKLRCKHCGYKWNYRGHSKYYACCPRCHWLVRVTLTPSKGEGSPLARRGAGVNGSPGSTLPRRECTLERAAGEKGGG